LLAQSKDGASQVLVPSSVVEHPAPESLKRLEHEYSLKEELDPAVVRQTDHDGLVHSEYPGTGDWSVR